MIGRRDGVLIAVCLVVGLALHYGHVEFPHLMPIRWADTGSPSLSAGFVVHMAELKLRSILASVGAVVRVR